MQDVDEVKLRTALLGEDANLDYSSLSYTAVLAKAVSLKEKGNSEFKHGAVFANHTIGRNQLGEACKFYVRVRPQVFDLNVL